MVVKPVNWGHIAMVGCFGCKTFSPFYVKLLGCFNKKITSMTTRAELADKSRFKSHFSHYEDSTCENDFLDAIFKNVCKRMSISTLRYLVGHIMWPGLNRSFGLLLS